MASVLLVGGDVALLEGLSQTLVAAGHQPYIATTIAEGIELASAVHPLVLLAERQVTDVMRLPLAPGGAVLLFHNASDQDTPLAPPLQRSALADLALPLERQRMLALIAHVDERVRATGRDRKSPHPGEVRL